MAWTVDGVGLQWQNVHGYDNESNESGEELSASLGTVLGVGLFVQGHNGMVSERGRSSWQGQWMGWSVKGVGLRAGT